MRRMAMLVGLFFVCCPGVLCAQSTDASIAGRVTDPSKAVVVGAKVCGSRSKWVPGHALGVPPDRYQGRHNSRARLCNPRGRIDIRILRV